jgi:hypothetical protein
VLSFIALVLLIYVAVRPSTGLISCLLLMSGMLRLLLLLLLLLLQSLSMMDSNRRRWPAMLTVLLLWFLAGAELATIMPYFGGYDFVDQWCDDDHTLANHKPINVVQGTVDRVSLSASAAAGCG